MIMLGFQRDPGPGSNMLSTTTTMAGLLVGSRRHCILPIGLAIRGPGQARVQAKALLGGPLWADYGYLS